MQPKTRNSTCAVIISSATVEISVADPYDQLVSIGRRRGRHQMPYILKPKP